MIMGLFQTIRQWQDARRERKANDRMERLAEQIVLPAKMRDFESMKGLFDKYRYAPSIVQRMTEHLAAQNLIRTPEDAANRDVLAMMESLKNTDYALKTGVRLVYTPTENTGTLHRMIAMHTFMLNEYGNTHRDCKVPLPERNEVYSAKRILNECRKEQDAEELAMLAIIGIEPSEYVKLRYNLKEEYSPHKRLNPEGNFKRVLSGKAADILEKEFANKLPLTFVMGMKHDREILRLFSAQPDSDSYLRISAPCNAFDVLPRETKEERLVRIAKAYAHLDMRISRMTGGKPMLPYERFLNEPLFTDAFRRKDYLPLCDLVRLNRDNVQLIREWTEQIAKAPLLCNVGETVNPLLGSLITQLNITRHGQETGIIPGGKNKEVSPLHLLNAYYTVMRHEHSVRFTGANLPIPTPEELRTATGVLDRVRRGYDRDELRRTAAGKGEPSDYVKIRYGLSDSYQKVSSLLHLRAEEALADNFYSMASLKEKADKVEENIRQMASSHAQGISEGKVPDNPLDALRNDKEMLDIITNRHWGEYAVPDRNFQLRYGLDVFFDAIGKIEQRRQGEPDLKEHFDFLTSQQENVLRFEASHEGERIGDKLSYLEYRRNKDAPKQDEGMSNRQQEGLSQRGQPSKQRKPTF